MCTKEEKEQMVKFLAKRLGLPEHKVHKLVSVALKRLKATCESRASTDQLLGELAANAALCPTCAKPPRLLARYTAHTLHRVGSSL